MGRSAGQVSKTPATDAGRKAEVSALPQHGRDSAAVSVDLKRGIVIFRFGWRPKEGHEATLWEHIGVTTVLENTSDSSVESEQQNLFCEAKGSGKDALYWVHLGVTTHLSPLASSVARRPAKRGGSLLRHDVP